MRSVAPIPSLEKLSQLKDIFSTLIRGRHINRLQDGLWWNELERERATYDALFTHLGYSLVVDDRGFAMFETDEPTQNIANKTRNLALVLLALFERQADLGLNMTRFHEWIIDQDLLKDLLERSRPMLEAEGLSSMGHLVATMGNAVSYGFAFADGDSRWRLLPATWRYLDRFTEVEATNQPAQDMMGEEI